MSVKAWEKYQPNASSPSPQYPYGSLRQETALGMGDGTPLDVEWGNDFEAFKQTAFSRSGLVPSGNTDTVTNSEMFNAMQDSTTRALWKRSAAESGYNLVDGSFEEGGALVNANDVLWSKKLNKIFSGPAGAVTSGTNPVSSGFVDRSGALLSSKLRTNLAYFMALPNVASEANTAALEAAFNSGVPLYGTGKYIATRPIKISNTFDFNSMSGNMGCTFSVSGDFEFFHPDETKQYNFQWSKLTGVKFETEIDLSGYAIKSTTWMALWVFSDVVFSERLKTAIDCPIILTKFNDCRFTENGSYPLLVHDGRVTGTWPTGRMNNANKFSGCSFRSRFDRLSTATHSISIIFSEDFVFDDCEMGMRGGTAGVFNADAVNNLQFMGGTWLEGCKAPHFVDCNNAAGHYRPRLILFSGCHLEPQTGMLAWVGVTARDNTADDTGVAFEYCDERGSRYLTRNKSTGIYNDRRDLISAAGNWLSAGQTVENGKVSVNRRFDYYFGRAIVGGPLVVGGDSSDPLLQIVSNAASWTFTGNSTGKNITLRGDGITNWNYQWDDTAYYPGSDNLVACGKPALRWSVVRAGTGTISTSDARMKTSVRRPSDAEVNVGLEIANEIGFYKWLVEIEKKGDSARMHSGVTVQRVIEIFEKHGLNPFEYGAVCYDKWEEYTETVPETLDENGNVLAEEHTMHHPAGDIYSLRNDEIHYLMIGAIREQQRRMEERISRLEQLA